MTIDLRIQRRRAKGYRTPPGTVYVGRPTKWVNPYIVSRTGRDEWRVYGQNGQVGNTYNNELRAKEIAVLAYQMMMENELKANPNALDELKGKPLSCWCKIGQPCHRDVLIELANGDG